MLILNEMFQLRQSKINELIKNEICIAFMHFHTIIPIKIRDKRC